MLSLASAQHEVRRSVIGPVPVQVMHPLAARERTPQDLLHDAPVFHDETAHPIAIDEHPHVPLCRVVAAGTVVPLAPRRVQARQAASVRAETIRPRAPMGRTMKRRAARLAANEVIRLADMPTAVRLCNGRVHTLSLTHFVKGLIT
jgi:hypothetical protein